MRDFVGPTDRTTIVALITRNQVAGIPFIPRVADAPSYVVRVPQIIRDTIITGTMRRPIQLIPVERPRRLPHGRTEPMPRALRLLAELVEGPAVRAGRGALKFFAREALEKRITDTVPRRAITVASVRTL